MEKLSIKDAHFKIQVFRKLDLEKAKERERSSVKEKRKTEKPDVIVSVDIEKVSDQEADLLIDELIKLKSKSKNIEYYDAGLLKSFFLYLYDSKQGLYVAGYKVGFRAGQPLAA